MVIIMLFSPETNEYKKLSKNMKIIYRREKLRINGKNYSELQETFVIFYFLECFPKKNKMP